MYFLDGSVPPPEIIDRFLEAAEKEKGAVLAPFAVFFFDPGSLSVDRFLESKVRRFITNSQG